MLSKKEVKDIQSLSQKKFREELKLFVAEGPKVVGELAEAVPHQVHKIIAVPDWIKKNSKLGAKMEVVEVTGVDLQRISFLQTAHEVVGVFHQFEHEAPDTDSFTLFLDTIQDPGNFGTIIRIADWFGVQSVVCSSGCADLYNPKVVQATMASIARVRVYYDEEGSWLQQQNATRYAATISGRSIYDHARVKKGILIIGNESRGIRKEYLDLVEERISIPGKGGAESLNAAVATGIILSHLLS